MARGLRSRLIGGAGQPQVGFLSGVGQALNRYADQMAAEQDPEVQLKRQLMGLKIQSMQGQLQAEQEQRQALQGAAEEMFPTGGYGIESQQTMRQPENPEMGQVLGGTPPEPLSPNDRLNKALINSGDLKAIQAIQAQQEAERRPQPTQGVDIVDLGGGQRGIRQLGGKITMIPTIQPKEPSYGAAIAERVAEMFGIPVSQATPDQLQAARRNITDEKNADSLKQFQQQKSIAIAMAQVGKDEEPMPPTYSYYDKTNGDKITVPSKGDYKSNRSSIAVLTPKDADYYDLLSTAAPNLDLMDKVLPKILKKSGGGPNLFTALGIKMERVGGSTPELAAFDMARNFLITNMTRVETGGVRPPQTLIKIVTNQLPLDRNTLQAAQMEIKIMRQEVKNRQGAMLGNKVQALPSPVGTAPPPPAGFK